MDPAEASNVGAKLNFSLCLVGEKGSILAKAVRPGGLFPLPQGKKVNRERLTSLEIGLFPLPEGEKLIPEKEILRGWGVKAGCKMRVPFRPPGEGKGQVHPEGVPPPWGSRFERFEAPGCDVSSAGRGKWPSGAPLGWHRGQGGGGRGR